MAEWNIRLIDKIFGKTKVVDDLGLEEKEEGVNFRPIITVSRDPGSGGHPIAKLVAEKLGFVFYNKKLIKEIAASTKARQEIIKEIDEKQRSLIDELVHNLVNPEYVGEEKYIKSLAKLVMMITQKGRAVLLGRGTNFMVPSAYALRVRVTAPYRVCVARAVKYEGVPYSRAREIINKVADERAGFVKQYFNKDIANPKYYDLTLNTVNMTIEDAAQLIVLAFKRKFPRY